jgi:hypothetical protein
MALAATMIAVHAGTPQFQQLAPRCAQRCQIILILRIEPPPRRQPIRRQQTVDPHHILQSRRIAAGVDQQQMVENRVEIIAFQPRRMIDQGAIRPQFLDKDAIAQPLGRLQIAGVARQPQGKDGLFGNHSTLWPLAAPHRKPQMPRPASCTVQAPPLQHGRSDHGHHCRPFSTMGCFSHVLRHDHR